MAKLKVSYSYLIGDLLHFGHLELLKKAKMQCDLHICGVISDKAANEWQSPLICNYKERSEVIKKIEYVDKIMIQHSLDPSKNLEKIIKEYPEATIYFFPMYQKWNFLPGTKLIKEVNGKIIKPGFYSKLSRDNIRKAFKDSPKPNMLKSSLSNKSNYDHTFDINTTKAETLKNLSSQLKKSYIEKLFTFNIKEWRRSSGKIIEKSQEIFGDRKVVIRSSSLSEDTMNISGAGIYHSELNVDNTNKNHLRSSINKVQKSYSKGKMNPLDQIIIQKQSNDILISGVCLTRNLKNNSPYYIINFDDKSTLTDTVTSGLVGDKVEIIRNIETKNVPTRWKNLIIAIKEIESLLPNLALDIEFAINEKKEIIIFQVRPLAANSKYPEYDDKKIFDSHEKINKIYKEKTKHSHYKECILSDMGFWNPAELIGDRPTPLAESLFNEILMNSVWNTSLLSLGYSNSEGCLSIRIGNKPYINLNKSFETLLPKGISESLKNKLIQYYNQKLKKFPQYHDKLEFEIVLSSFNLNTEHMMSELKNNGFTQKELNNINKLLFNLTNSIFKNYKRIFFKDTKSILKLVEHCKYIKTTKDNWKENIGVILSYLTELQKNGTPQFCRAARLAFLAKDFMKSFSDQHPQFREDCEAELSKIKTISSVMQKDLTTIKDNKDKLNFFKQYGHLRPDTYNINNKRYDQINNLLSKNLLSTTKKSNIVIKSAMKNEIDSSLKRLKLDIDYKNFINFLGLSIKNREKYKFEYTKVISTILEMIADVGVYINIKREELAYIDIQTLKMLQSDGIDAISAHELCSSLITARKKSHKILNQISLPSLLFNKKDLTLISNHTIIPNFITDHIVESKIINIKKQEANITNKIVVIDNADPGYDWIFSYKIKGLVTLYGGMASHMAIRCAEFNIPAAIGCGALLYERVNSSEKIILDCKNKKIKKII